MEPTLFPVTLSVLPLFAKLDPQNFKLIFCYCCVNVGFYNKPRRNVESYWNRKSTIQIDKVCEIFIVFVQKRFVSVNNLKKLKFHCYTKSSNPEIS